MEPVFTLGNLLTIIVIILAIGLQYVLIVSRVSKMEAKYDVEMQWVKKELQEIKKESEKLGNRYLELYRKIYGHESEETS